MSSSIKFIISPDGNSVKIQDICGAPGKACLEVSKDYEKILGEVRESTREYVDDVEEYEQNITQQNG